MVSKREFIEEAEETHKKTKETEDIILENKKLVEMEENLLSEFYNKFQSLSNKMLQELESKENISDALVHNCFEFKDKIIEQLSLLKEIYSFAEHEKIREEERISKEINVTENLKTEIKLLKKFDVSKDLRRLTNEIVSKINKELKMAEEDKDTDSKVTEHIKEAVKLLFSIKEILDKIIKKELKGEELKIKLQELNGKINQQLDGLKQLENIEKLHLQILLKLYIDELSVINLEKKLKKKEDEAGIGEVTQDKTILMDE